MDDMKCHHVIIKRMGPSSNYKFHIRWRPNMFVSQPINMILDFLEKP